MANNKADKPVVPTLILLVLSLFLLLINGSLLRASDEGTGKVSTPFEYKGYSFPVYRNYTRSSQYVSMFDGTKIATDVYLPKEGPGNASFPVLLAYHPYYRMNIDPENGQLKNQVMAPEGFIKYFTSHGYGIVVADMRGSGASFGSRLDMSPQLGMDGKQIIDWIETQPWCNGNVGMYGASYGGWSQFAVAAQKPRALKAIMPEIIGFDSFECGLYYCGGIFSSRFLEMLGGVFHLYDMAVYLPETRGTPQPKLPPAPVVDEDGDGDLADEIPLYNSEKSFLNSPPVYRDGKKRQGIYYNAIKEHLSNLDIRKWVPASPYRNSRIAGTRYAWTDIGPNDWPMKIAESGIAIYNMGGWFDFFTKGTTQWHATLNATNPSRMMMQPLTHNAVDIGTDPGPVPYPKYFGDDVEAFISGKMKERLRFFDRYLKGIRNGIDDDQRVLIYVMNGGGWRSEKEWPLARQVVIPYYFEKGNSLVRTTMSDGLDLFRADLTHDTRSGPQGNSRWMAGWQGDEILKGVCKEPQCLSYTSEFLKVDTEVTGHPIVRLWVSSTANDGDFYVYLEDIDEKGESSYITEGKLRAGFAKLVPQEEMLPPGKRLPVLPELPYHGFRDTDYNGGIFAGGKKVELVLDLQPTSWVFKKGHRMRVSIACADWPTYDLHPALSPKNDPKDPENIIPAITVYHDAQHPSRIELPIIPPER
ncbi:MAG: CocE/NonD family hydrolase [Deltaproteobacteria bacterium]|nr:CocE/NonD family hydrolase [Deltaproteobacteria bacterium]